MFNLLKYLACPVIACLGIFGCAAQAPLVPPPLIATYPLHYEKDASGLPISVYPDADKPVTYTLDVEAVNEVKSIELYHYIQGVDLNGTITPDGNSANDFLECWGDVQGKTCQPLPSSPISVSFSVGGYSINKYISYEFVITDNDPVYPGTKSHTVSYAIKPYPPSTVAGSEQPIPVYAQEDVGQAMDSVFIKSICNHSPNYYPYSWPEFYVDCYYMIKDGLRFDISSDNRTKSLWQYFNFFINPLEGTANPNPFSHSMPVNDAQLSFAEGHAFLHAHSDSDIYFMDHADMNGTTFSTRRLQRGTMVHEAGHALFGLVDEYGPEGEHSQATVLPNNWNKKVDAGPAKECRPGTGPKKISQIRKHKICNWKGDNQCQMNVAGDVCIKYDVPCRHRVEYIIKENAGIATDPCP